MKNIDRIKQMTVSKLSKFLRAIVRTSCSYPKLYQCDKCVAREFCYLERKSENYIKQWLEQESGG